jgi:ABC-type polar amino acid transport system ATPase subunit
LIAVDGEPIGYRIRLTYRPQAAHAGARYPRARERIGMVFQSFSLFPHMNVLQNSAWAGIAADASGLPQRVESRPEPATSRLISTAS